MTSTDPVYSVRSRVYDTTGRYVGRLPRVVFRLLSTSFFDDLARCQLDCLSPALVDLHAELYSVSLFQARALALKLRYFPSLPFGPDFTSEALV